IKVLLVDQAPRWEFKYIEAMLLREARVDLDVFLLEADRAVALVPGSPHIESFPELPEDLFAYDLVIFGDIDPRQLSPSALDLLSDYVARTGGALAIVAGKRFMPAAYRRTALEPVLPVTIRTTALTNTTPTASRPASLQPTQAGLDSAMLAIGNSDDIAAEWRALPPIYWSADIDSVKPAAEVLVTRDAGTPVITLHRFGAGEVLFVGTDNTWRWRKNQGDATHTRFWGQVVQRLAGHRLAGGPRHLRIETTQREYAPGDRVTVLAQIHDSAWNPIDTRDLRATLTSTDGSTGSRSLSLSPVPDRPGFFRTEINAGQVGAFTIALPDSPATPARFSVRTDNPEHSQLALNEPVLKAVAERTGGTYVTDKTLLNLVASLTSQKTTISTTREFDLWTAPLTIIILISLITTEWIVRKFTELK
ncbi:MAG: glutamine amidotransferase, partial [Verrucomicrobiales bacterium]|nr:glutamine amidotransferase [Verrucomicrobiales bacterium]